MSLIFTGVLCRNPHFFQIELNPIPKHLICYFLIKIGIRPPCLLTFIIQGNMLSAMCFGQKTVIGLNFICRWIWFTFVFLLLGSPFFDIEIVGGTAATSDYKTVEDIQEVSTHWDPVPLVVFVNQVLVTIDRFWCHFQAFVELPPVKPLICLEFRISFTLARWFVLCELVFTFFYFPRFNNCFKFFFFVTDLIGPRHLLINRLWVLIVEIFHGNFVFQLVSFRHFLRFLWNVVKTVTRLVQIFFGVMGTFKAFICLERWLLSV